MTEKLNEELEQQKLKNKFEEELYDLIVVYNDVGLDEDLAMGVVEQISKSWKISKERKSKKENKYETHPY